MLVRHNETKKEFVAKKLNIHAMPQKDQQSSKQEAQILKTLSHPHIVTFEESFLENGVLVIIMEHCANGDLSKLIKSYKEENRMIPEGQICSWFVQIASAVNYIHSRKIIHRDIKASTFICLKMEW